MAEYALKLDASDNIGWSLSGTGSDHQLKWDNLNDVPEWVSFSGTVLPGALVIESTTDDVGWS